MTKKFNTIHHSRTIMFDEVERIVETGKLDNNFIKAIDNNVLGKKSQTALRNAKSKLLGIYSFDIDDPPFLLFLNFWDDSKEDERRLLTLLMALKEDSLLKKSIEFIQSVPVGEKIEKQPLVKYLSKYVDYTENTLKSSSRNIISSWKQAGFIGDGKSRLRTQPKITYQVVAYAIVLGVLDGLEGEFLVKSPYIQALGLSSDMLNQLLNEANINDLLKYQNTGGVVSISLTDKLSINDQ